MRTNHERSESWGAGELVDGVAMVPEVCRACERPSWIREHRQRLRNGGVYDAGRRRNQRALFDWLMGGLSYQGVSDSAAQGYIAVHGNVTYASVARALRRKLATCPKLHGFDAYVACGYRKAARTCSKPKLLRGCPVPTHDLRRGGLNQMAYSLYFFLRDICRGDLGGFIEQVLAVADGDDPELVEGTDLSGMVEAALDAWSWPTWEFGWTPAGEDHGTR